MKNILVVGILITCLGTIIFFPLNINGKYTCIFHRIFDHSHPVLIDLSPENGHIHILDIDPTVGENNTLRDQGDNNSTEQEMIMASHGSVLLDKYLDEYAFRWWASIGFLALSIMMWINLRKKSRNNNSNMAIQ